jgi:hypothetical protein
MAIRVQSTLADNIKNAVFNQFFKKIGLFYNNVEISGQGYARATGSSFVYHSEDTDYFYYVNSTQISFPTALSAWGNVNQVGFFDINGILQCIVDLNFTIVVSAGNTLIFYPNTLILRIPKVMR